MVDPFHGPTLPDMRIEVCATPVTAPLLRPSSDGMSRAVAERLMGRCLAVEVRHVGARVTVVGLRDVIDGRSVPALERRLAGAVRRGQRMRLGFCLICSPSSSLIDGGWTLRLQACLVEAGGGFDLRDAVNGRWCGCFMRRTGRRRPVRWRRGS